MASLSDIVIKSELRPCLVHGKPALFHTWEHWALDDIKKVFGIIEDENGRIIKVNPTSIQFLNNKINEYYFDDLEGSSQEVDGCLA